MSKCSRCERWLVVKREEQRVQTNYNTTCHTHDHKLPYFDYVCASSIPMNTKYAISREEKREEESYAKMVQ